ncbi:MAG TPA: alpha/beta fold hydrolase [Casimicrobiaceae bacterium]|nr:alpha/beta fold hydrolase [Casimicrobiaceae bacterium]
MESTSTSTAPTPDIPPAVSVIRDTPRARTGYFVAGTGTPVVMLHSSLGSKGQWSALAEQMSARYRVIALDLCGYGDNPPVTSTASFTLDDEVRLVADRLDALVEPHVRVHVIAHSYGALVALRLAQRARGRVASLALYEPVAFRLLADDEPVNAEVKRLAERVARLVASGHRHAAALAFVDFWSGNGSFAALPLPAQTAIARRVDKLPLDFQAARSWPRNAEDLRVITAPTLLVSGDRSPAVMRRIHRILMRFLPNARVAALDAGHMGPITDSAHVNAWIEAFIDECAAQSARLPGMRSGTALGAAWAAD